MYKKPVADVPEDDAWFPFAILIDPVCPPKTDFDGEDYSNAYKRGKWKVLLIATQEGYRQMENHPLEMRLPVLHLDAAGLDIDIATVSDALACSWPMRLSGPETISEQ